jgi:hypothetical protein
MTTRGVVSRRTVRARSEAVARVHHDGNTAPKGDGVAPSIANVIDRIRERHTGAGVRNPGDESRRAIVPARGHQNGGHEIE